MIAEYICKGLLIGFIFGVPAGAIGALTIGRTLDKGFAAGFLTGMGSSAADLIYSCVGVFGITVVSDVLSAGQNILQIIGGILILLLGGGVLCKKRAAAVQGSTVQKESKGTLAFCFLSAFTTALVNPATVLSFMAAFAAFGIQGGLDAGQGTVLIIGIFIGTLCWWLALSGVTAHFRDKVTGKIYRWLNCILGCLMIGFGILMAVGGLKNGLEQEEMIILMKIGDEAVAVEWEDNESVSALTELLREQPLSIQMSMYGDFEQVGSLRTNPPTK